MPTVLLLDIDGVLVNPGGYRAALHGTLDHFAGLMGLPHLDIPEENLEELERQGISSEWDMVPLLLGALWNDILSRQPSMKLPADPSSAAVEIGRFINDSVRTDISVPQLTLAAGQYPAEMALQQGCYSHIPLDLRRNLLHDTRNIHFSQTMRLFQHFTLGSRTFTETYDLPPEVDAESLLLLYDQSNIDESMRSKLRQPGIHLAAFTARPSALPRGVNDFQLGYAPEAELALELVKLPNIPLIAFGKLQYIASRHGLDPVTLLKPSPFQALAAIAAALTGEEMLALQAAYDWHRTGQLNGVFMELPRTFDLIVVEDTMGGIRSTWAAGEILQRWGFDVTVQAFGMTSGSDLKAVPFREADVPYFNDWNTLMTRLAP
jgi:hypothetical protein